MTQRSNTISAINGNIDPADYTQTYVYTTFGDPDEKTESVTDGVRTEVWTYKTRVGEKELLFNMHPKKTRYMKITITNKIVTNVAFE